MISASRLDEYRRALAYLGETTRDSLAAAYQAAVAAGLDPAGVQAVVYEAAVEANALLGDLAGATSADFYQALRAEQLGENVFWAEIAPRAGDEEVRQAVYHAGRMLEDREVTTDSGHRVYRADRDAFMRETTARVEQMVLDVARETMTVAAAHDDTPPRWKIIAQPGACAWCADAASQGWSWPSQTDAAATRFHEHCRCVVAVDWESTPRVEGDTYGATRVALGDYSVENPF